MNKFFSISDLIICFKSETEIDTSPLFKNFIIEPAVPDVIVNVIRGNLPETDDGLYKKYSHVGVERNFSCRVKKSFNEYDLYIDFPDKLWDSAVFYALDFSYILLENSRVMCHCSYVLKNDEAVLFAGFKQVGKSTQAELWRKYANAEIINGDRAILIKKGDRLLACGTPYCGSSKIAVNKTAKVKAIILLSQGKENTVTPVNQNSEKLSLILPNLSYDDNHVNEMLDMAETICTSVPIYKYSCLPDRDAVSIMEKVLWN